MSTTRERALYVLFSLFLAGCGLALAFRLSEPPGRTPSPSEVRQVLVEDRKMYDEELTRLAGIMVKRQRAVKPADFQTKFDLANVYARILKTRRLRDTRGANSTYTPDRLFRAMLSKCRDLAANKHDDSLIDKLESGEHSLPIK